ncbi:hypothetical protein AwDysgo_12740 [Bacteroidales bacterium]|nr:hypothetical protein AwDysgo_12740 [Bacteroidales bacterium]
MKKISLFALILVLSLAFMQAQNRSGGSRMTVEERAKSITTWMTTELELRDDQIVAVDSINLLFTKTQQILFQSANGDRDKIRESMSGLEKQKEEALAKVLSDKQLTTYKEKAAKLLEERRSRKN